MRRGSRFGARALFACALLTGAAPALAIECEIGRAVYGPIGASDEPADEGYRLVHTDRPALRRQSRLSVTLSHRALGQSHDFTYAFSNGYGRTSLVYAGPTGARLPARLTDQSPGSPIMFFDADMKLAPAPQSLSDKAPGWLIMPEMGLRFWYGGDQARKFIPPDGLWKLTACR